MGKADWTYGKEGNAYPVKPGQVWKTGEHVFVCSDLLASKQLVSVIDQLEITPTLIYTDPPWNQSNVSSFRTKAGLSRTEDSYLDLYKMIGLLAQRYRVPVFAEGGTRQVKAVQSVLPGAHRATAPITYYRKHPAVLHYAGDEPISSYLQGRLNSKDDDHTPGIVLGLTHQGHFGVVLDPCAGRGLTARTAEKTGWTSITNELSPWRMSVAMHRLHKASGLTPERVQ